MNNPIPSASRRAHRLINRPVRRVVFVAVLVACLALLAVSIVVYHTITSRLKPGGPVFIIMLENRERANAIGSAMPYLTSLATANAQASQMYAITHPSLPNRVAVTAGATFGITDDTVKVLNVDNIFDQIERAGKGWKLYAEDMPIPCDTRESDTYPAYHNSALYYASIRNNTSRCAAHVQPLTQLTTDIANHTVPAFVWIEPNQLNNGHDTSASDADHWLAGFVPTILDSTAYKNGGKLIITFDEGETKAGCCNNEAAGGNIAFVAMSPGGPHGLVDSRQLTMYSLERTIGDLLGVTVSGAGATAPSLTDLFARTGTVSAMSMTRESMGETASMVAARVGSRSSRNCGERPSPQYEQSSIH